MLIRRLFLYKVILLALYPTLSMAVPLYRQRHSTLPCLVGQPGFSERLIAHNPKLSGKSHLLSDSVLGHLMVMVKCSAGPFSSVRELEQIVPRWNTWKEYLEYTTTALSSVGTLGTVGEIAIYFNRLTGLYLSGLKGDLFNSVAFVIGGGGQPFNLHASIGKFPIHFGSGFSEYPLANPLQVDMGATANVPAVSLNGGYRWNLKHQTKLRVFGFIGDLVVWTEKTEKIGTKARGLHQVNSTKDLQKKEKLCSGIDGYWGINVHHEWAPVFGSLSVGASGVSGLPIRAIRESKDPKDEYYRENQNGFNLYTHITAGAFKIKIEGLSGGVNHKKVKRWFNKLKRGSKTKDETISGLYAGHAEIAYCLPIKKESTIIIGYTQGVSELLSAQKRVFAGFKAKLLENVQCIVGYQCEHGLKKQANKRNKYVALDEKNRHQEWRHGITVQFNLTL